jgi:hypothetical protein
VATYYIDKRVAVNGNGTEASPWKACNEACDQSIPAGSTIQFVPGSGPYYKSDFTFLSQAMWFPNHKSGGTTIWDLGGNTWTSELDLSSGGEWHESVESGLYYYTAAGGANPSIATVLSGIVDGVWNAVSTSLFGPYPSNTPHHSKKWGYGDRDTLGFNTVYVKGFNPSESGHSILLSVTDTLLVRAAVVTNPAFHIVRNGNIRGGGQYSSRISIPARFENITFANNDAYAVRMSANIDFRWCKFIDCGHQSWDTDGSGQNVTAYHCHFENVHVIKKLHSAYTRTTTVINCTSKNLLAGAFQHDSATETLVENNNQFHIDPDGDHGGTALAFTTGTRQWTVTAASDLPPSTDTSTRTIVDPLITNDRMSDFSPCTHAGAVVSGINDAGQLDPFGFATPAHPNMGRDQGAAKGFGPWATFDTSMPPLSLASTCPGSLLEVQEWTKANVTKRQIDSV